MTPAEVLNGAADRIEEFGHYKGDYGDDPWNSKTCRVCLWGALYAAVAGDPFAEVGYDDVPVLRPVVGALLNMLNIGHGFELGEWNDAPERTPEDVVGLLREAAKRVAA